MEPIIRMQLPSELEISSPYSPQRANYYLRLGNAPSKGASERCSAP
jgi:hypothetical protein